MLATAARFGPIRGESYRVVLLNNRLEKKNELADLLQDLDLRAPGVKDEKTIALRRRPRHVPVMSGAWIILKTGSTLPEIAERRGDFEDWIRDGMGLTSAEVDVVAVAEGAPLPRPEGVRAVVVTGSSAMVTDREAWSVRSASWLRELCELRRPILGICYGHQLLADALGGAVAGNPDGREIGTVSLRRTAAGREDPLFSVLDETFWAHESHAEAVVRLPPAATLLASNQAIENQAFVVGRAWGVQFHPEFDADIVRGYIRRRSESIRAEGGDPERLERATRDLDTGPRLLKRFFEVVSSM